MPPPKDGPRPGDGPGPGGDPRGGDPDPEVTPPRSDTNLEVTPDPEVMPPEVAPDPEVTPPRSDTDLEVIPDPEVTPPEVAPTPEVAPDPEGTVAGTSPGAWASLLEVLALYLFPGSADAETPPSSLRTPPGRTQQRAEVRASARSNYPGIRRADCKVIFLFHFTSKLNY